MLSKFLDNLQLSFFERKSKQTASFLPKEIQFRSVQKSVLIEYISTPDKNTTLREHSGILHISGNLQRTLVKKTINKWIAKQAKAYFVPELEKCSERTGLIYSNVRFKNAKSRWGSCSDKKTINLNIQMLFLPKHLSDQVLLHELCHLAHLNHSKNFWNLVASFEPNYKSLERELKHEGRKHIPRWILRN